MRSFLGESDQPFESNPSPLILSSRQRSMNNLEPTEQRSLNVTQFHPNLNENLASSIFGIPEVNSNPFAQFVAPKVPINQKEE